MSSGSPAAGPAAASWTQAGGPAPRARRSRPCRATWAPGRPVLPELSRSLRGSSVPLPQSLRGSSVLLPQPHAAGLGVSGSQEPRPARARPVDRLPGPASPKATTSEATQRLTGTDGARGGAGGGWVRGHAVRWAEGAVRRVGRCVQRAAKRWAGRTWGSSRGPACCSRPACQGTSGRWKGLALPQSLRHARRAPRPEGRPPGHGGRAPPCSQRSGCCPGRSVPLGPEGSGWCRRRWMPLSAGPRPHRPGTVGDPAGSARARGAGQAEACPSRVPGAAFQGPVEPRPTWAAAM